MSRRGTTRCAFTLVELLAVNHTINPMTTQTATCDSMIHDRREN
jgi:hypothetical protein